MVEKSMKKNSGKKSLKKSSGKNFGKKSKKKLAWKKVEAPPSGLYVLSSWILGMQICDSKIKSWFSVK